MPNPRKNEKKSKFISRCIPEVMKEGYKQNQSIAICESKWSERKRKAKASIDIGNNDEILIDDSEDNV